MSKMGISAVVRLKLQYIGNCSLMAYAVLIELWGILSKRRVRATSLELNLLTPLKSTESIPGTSLGKCSVRVKVSKRLGVLLFFVLRGCVML